MNNGKVVYKRDSLASSTVADVQGFGFFLVGIYDERENVVKLEEKLQIRFESGFDME